MKSNPAAAVSPIRGVLGTKSELLTMGLLEISSQDEDSIEKQTFRQGDSNDALVRCLMVVTWLWDQRMGREGGVGCVGRELNGQANPGGVRSH